MQPVRNCQLEPDKNTLASCPNTGNCASHRTATAGSHETGEDVTDKFLRVCASNEAAVEGWQGVVPVFETC